MNILQISNYYEYHGGGLEKVVAHLSRALIRKGHSVKWIASKLPESAVEGIECHPVNPINFMENLFSFPYPFWSVTDTLSLRTHIEQSDIVHIHDGMYWGSFWSAIFARQLGKPFVVTQHIGEFPCNNLLWQMVYALGEQFLTRPVLYLANHRVFYSECVRQRYAAKPAPKNHLIFNGVDTSVFNCNFEDKKVLRDRLGVSSNKPLFLFVGRFVAKKGLHHIYEVARQMDSVNFVIIGCGKLNPQAWHLPNVRVIPYLPHQKLAEWYRAADALMLPSVGEGFPLVIQEALACATPSIVSAEIIDACRPASPFMISAGPAGESLLTACQHAVKDLGSLHALGMEGAQWAHQEWSWEATATRYEELFLCERVT